MAAEHGSQLQDLGFEEGSRRYEHYQAAFVPQALRRLWEIWERLNDGSVAGLDVRTCRPGEDPVVGPMLSRYLERWGDRFFDAPDSALDYAEWGHFVVTRDPQDHPIALFKVVDRGTDHAMSELEVIYGEGNEFFIGR